MRGTGTEGRGMERGGEADVCPRLPAGRCGMGHPGVFFRSPDCYHLDDGAEKKLDDIFFIY